MSIKRFILSLMRANRDIFVFAEVSPLSRATEDVAFHFNAQDQRLYVMRSPQTNLWGNGSFKPWNGEQSS